ncbi:MAG: biotin/lipoyl-binding protein [Prevotella sp.]|nr:biotin/lipoyl-binding protein [Alistipes senegalensis]MCM1357911.1 biotin/lipoyl-binding protein [Prevotella sp.]MCM1474510.1 biotin/lipoyl-binding protein [Muribaculaceae bacterium]
MKYRITLNGKTYEVEVEHGKAILLDEYEALASAPAVAPAPVESAPTPVPSAPAPVSLADGETISAPMPGNIIRVDVKEGDKVKSGQVLVILEAMKMENEIVATKDGTIAQVVTSKGAVVETGSPLIVIA